MRAQVDPIGELCRLLQEGAVVLTEHTRIHHNASLLRGEDRIHQRNVLQRGVAARVHN